MNKWADHEKATLGRVWRDLLVVVVLSGAVASLLTWLAVAA